jgi:hypothetical protein
MAQQIRSNVVTKEKGGYVLYKGDSFMRTGEYDIIHAECFEATKKEIRTAKLGRLPFDAYYATGGWLSMLTSERFDDRNDSHKEFFPLQYDPRVNWSMNEWLPIFYNLTLKEKKACSW